MDRPLLRRLRQALTSPWGAPSLAALGGIAYYAAYMGWWTLDPRNIGWLYDHGDHAQHFTAWAMYRNEPLFAWPLGRISGIMYPLGATTGFSDAVPLPSLLFRALSPLLPQTFQFFGLWLASCFALMGWLGARLAAHYRARPVEQVLVGLIFGTSAGVLSRSGFHEALAAHWLIVAGLLTYARGAKAGHATRPVAITIAIAAVSAGIHPYLMALCFGIAAVTLLRFWWIDRALSVPQLAAAAGALGGTTGVILLAFGYFGLSGSANWSGYGKYSADLTALFNPIDSSRWVPSFPTLLAQRFEGFAYLGLGVLALLLIGMVELVRRWRELDARGMLRRWAPMLVLALLCAYNAASPVFTFAGKSVGTAYGLYHRLQPLLDIFRSNGRFVWPLQYLAVTAAVALVLRAFAAWPRARAAILAAAVVLQLGERHPPHPPPSATWPAKQAPEWQLARGEYRHLLLYPPQVIYETTQCWGPKGDYYADWTYLAAQLGMTINSGRSGRFSIAQADELCAGIQRDVKQRVFRDDAVYVVDAAHEQELLAAHDLVACARLDGTLACAARSRRTAFVEALERAESGQGSR